MSITIMETRSGRAHACSVRPVARAGGGNLSQEMVAQYHETALQAARNATVLAAATGVKEGGVVSVRVCFFLVSSTKTPRRSANSLPLAGRCGFAILLISHLFLALWAMGYGLFLFPVSCDDSYMHACTWIMTSPQTQRQLS